MRKKPADGATPGRHRPQFDPTVPSAWCGWVLGRALVVLLVLGVLKIPHMMDVTSDVKVIYQGWAEVLRSGTFPMDDVTWQYPPLAALVMLAPLAVPASYFVGFVVLIGLCDALGLWLLLRLRRSGTERTDGTSRNRAGVWLWVVVPPLLGPTLYARFDLVVTVVAMAALVALVRRPKLAGVLTAVGAMLKVWPVLLLIGAGRGRRWRKVVTSCALSAALVGFLFLVSTHGAFSFLGFQEGRGIEVESLGALPFLFASVFLHWQGTVAMNYGSLEVLGPHVATMSGVMVASSVIAFALLALWRLRVRNWTPATAADAGLTAVLLFVVTSRVISPQYLLWLVGLAAVCLTLRGSVMRPVAWLVAVAVPVTTVEFPFMFGQLTGRTELGLVIIGTRNLLLLAAAVLAFVRLWRATVSSASPELPQVPDAVERERDAEEVSA
ncbi:glycosyltransferase 87 family protein [Streptacidiphilus sp. MAP5-3]|uniref:glycosyltransferase 87 family protein n=1 Tax=unclassified Streptacidiphilus TaxID=2643834 RepID=UPI0035111427